MADNNLGSPSVMELIHSRRKGIDDDFKLALSLDGGGMRGVVSGAMLIALHDLGLLHVFDRIFANSAASINIAHIANGGSWDALSMYYDYLPKNFFEDRAVLGAFPRLRMDYLTKLWTEDFPLRRDAIKASGLDVTFLVANVDSLSTDHIDMNDDSFDIVDVLRAGAWLPLLSGPPQTLSGTRYLDGGTLMPHPVKAAIDESFTHIVAMSPAAEQSPTWRSKGSRQFLVRVLDGWQPGLGGEYLKSRMEWDACRLRLPVAVESQIDRSRVIRIAPMPSDHRVTRLTRDRADLLDGARVGYAHIVNLLNLGKPSQRSHYFSVWSAGQE